MRIAYLDTLDTFVKEFAELPEDDEKRQNVVTTLENVRVHTIAVLDQSEEFLENLFTLLPKMISEDEEYDPILREVVMLYDYDAIVDQLRSNVLEVSFVKVDGDTRVMPCTLLTEYMPEASENESPKGR